MNIAVVKYSAGNIQSVLNALQRLGHSAEVTDDPARLTGADKVIFPGVGEASSAMIYLKQRGLDQVLLRLRQPLLGICLGLQLLCEHSEENDTHCLNIIPVPVKRLRTAHKVPHIGWNQITSLKGPLFKGVAEGSNVYFVHSFCADLSPYSSAITEYDQLFSAALSRDNFHAVQFHPEKSGSVGELILKNFIEL